MAKQSPFYLKSPVVRPLTFTFTDPENNPDNAFEVQLRRLTSLDALSYISIAEDYGYEYITGFGEEGKPGWVPPKPLPPVNGEIVRVTHATCKVLAAIEFAQVQPEEDRYRFEELAAMTVSPAIQEQMLQAFYEIQREAKDGPKAPTVTPTETSSSSASDGSSSTQASSNGKTASCVQSTPDSEPLQEATAGR